MTWWKILIALGLGVIVGMLLGMLLRVWKRTISGLWRKSRKQLEKT